MYIETSGQIDGFEYMVKNYKQYNIEGVETEKDMIALLNILQANGETLEDMHDFVGSHEDFFCGILFDNAESMGYLYDVLRMTYLFFDTIEELKEHMNETEGWDDLDFDADEYMNSDLDDQDVIKTQNGYIRTSRC